MHPSQRISPQRLMALGFLFGVALILAGLFFTVIFLDEEPGEAWYPRDGLLMELVGGTGAGLVGAALVWRSTQAIPAAQRLRDRMLAVIRIEAMTVPQAVFIGVLAAVPEEVFFRGALQPVMGLLPTALIFAALHALSRLYFLYALIAGLALGATAAWRGDLWAATAGHWSYDAALFVLMMWHARQNMTIIENQDVRELA